MSGNISIAAITDELIPQSCSALRPLIGVFLAAIRASIGCLMRAIRFSLPLLLAPTLALASSTAFSITNIEPNSNLLAPGTDSVAVSFNTSEATSPDEVFPSDDYFLKDIHGNKIQNWPTPGSYLLNLTKPEVATYLAHLCPPAHYWHA